GHARRRDGLRLRQAFDPADAEARLLGAPVQRLIRTTGQEDVDRGGATALALYLDAGRHAGPEAGGDADVRPGAPAGGRWPRLEAQCPSQGLPRIRIVKVG